MDNKTQYPIKPDGWHIAGFILLLVSVGIWILWINTFSSNPTASQAAKVAMFLSHFPLFLRNTTATSLLVTASSIGSIVFIFRGQKRTNRAFKIIGVLIYSSRFCIAFATVHYALSTQGQQTRHF